MRRSLGFAAFRGIRCEIGQRSISQRIIAHYKSAALDAWAKRAKAQAKRDDVFVYCTADAKGRVPSTARALIERL